MKSKESYALHKRALDVADEEIRAALKTRSGLQIDRTSDLINSRIRYPEAYPVLVDLLKQDFPIRMREMIVRALTIADARSVAYGALLKLYTEPEESGYKSLVGYESYRFALANAIGVLVPKTDRRVLLELVRDPQYGASRAAFLYAMRRWKQEDGVDEVILGALSDPDLQYAAIEAASTRRLTSTIPQVAKLTSSANQDVARLAKRSLKKLQQF